MSKKYIVTSESMTAKYGKLCCLVPGYDTRYEEVASGEVSELLDLAATLNGINHG